jgi:hypothetical protein
MQDCSRGRRPRLRLLFDTGLEAGVFPPEMKGSRFNGLPSIVHVHGQPLLALAERENR